MRTFLYPIKDTSIYRAYPYNNAGYDEILEVGKLDVFTHYVSGSSSLTESAPVRSLMQFEGLDAVPSGSIVRLKLYFASASNLDNSQLLNVFPLSQSWAEGTSYFYQTPYNAQDGASWYSASSTAAWGATGGAYLTSVSSSVVIESQPLTDVIINITDIAYAIVSSSIPDNGFVIRMNDATEQSITNKANCKFFSFQTHTIFQPRIEILLDNESYVTGSLKLLTSSSSAEIAAKSLKNEYERGERQIIRFLVRDKYPPKVFDLSPRYKAQYALPRNTFFEIKDVAANVVFYPADHYDRLSCDADGSYFVLDTAHLYKNREYELTINLFFGTEIERVHIGHFRVT